METCTDNLRIGANPELYEFAKALRHNATNAEELLWQQLRDKKFQGLKFRRQHAIGKFIADFYCHEKKLVVEVDVNVHDLREVKENDDARQGWFNEIGLKVLFSPWGEETEMRLILKHPKI